MRPRAAAARRTAVIDTDPVFTQLRMTHDAEFLGYYRQFDAVGDVRTADRNGPVRCADAGAELDRHESADFPAALAGRAAARAGEFTTHREMGTYDRASRGIQRAAVSEQQGGGMDEDAGFAAASAVENDDGDANDAGGDGQEVCRPWVELVDAEKATLSCEAFRDFIRGQCRGIYGGEGNLRGSAQRMVQRSEQRVSGQRPAGGDAGQRIRPLAADGGRIVFVRDAGQAAAALNEIAQGLSASRGGGAANRGWNISIQRRCWRSFWRR